MYIHKNNDDNMIYDCEPFDSIIIFMRIHVLEHDSEMRQTQLELSMEWAHSTCTDHVSYHCVSKTTRETLLFCKFFFMKFRLYTLGSRKCVPTSSKCHVHSVAPPPQKKTFFSSCGKRVEPLIVWDFFH